ncbi:hypothetical protein TDSAC_1690 [Thermodesulfobium acidiphilum]|uniref:Uncharacterized protein n=1 Tax=Thermodesulfobium acidiphilum TaxID=1794699 RepID=A0A2R4W2U7_THEAF|nr:hypothetical protein [Thermodesulfobium acidiphilum]AWB11026.1 hypothetical protein TDSAC_1690 [Thermodesulfobium acidiphilum]
MPVDQDFNEKFAKKFLIESELIKKISKDAYREDFKDIKGYLIPNI